MAAIVEKRDSDGNSKKFIILGAGRIKDSFGASEEPYLIVCDETGTITCQVDFGDRIKVLSIDGKVPGEFCK